MNTLSQDAQTGLDYLQQGNMPQAFEHLLMARNEGEKNPRAALAMAIVARSLSKFDQCLSAIDDYLVEYPRDINANIIKADALSGQGKIKTAATFYMGALKLAHGQNQLSPQLKQELMRAQEACQKTQQLFEDEMQQCIERLGFTGHSRDNRVHQALDILMGKKQLYPQRPTAFYLPELPHRQFYPPEEFQWAEAILEGKDTIKQELQSLLNDDNLFEPYVDHNPNAAQTGDLGFYKNKSWSSFHLYRSGRKIAENIERCPKTFDIVSQAPIPTIAGRSPNILFSQLQPGTHIQPHHGEINVRLLCHLPLIVPDGCFLRVGNDKRTVKENELMIFDDTIEHEAKNNSSSRRIVLIFDVWRPEIADDEKPVLSEIFKTIDRLD